MLFQLNHDNLLATEQVFSFEGNFFIISPSAAVSLEEFIVARPDEEQLAIIISQV